jgi:hypothetical protein
MAVSSPAEGVVVHPAPEGAPVSDRYAVAVAGKEAPACITTSGPDAALTAGNTLSWVGFDMAVPAEVRVRRLDRRPESVTVRPASAGAAASVQADEVIVRVPCPGAYCVEVNDDLHHVLMLFANPPEPTPPTPNDPGVTVFGPGVHDVGRQMPLPSGRTVYLAPGAYVRGTFAGGGDGTRVCGRGVLSGEAFRWPGHQQENSPERVDLLRLTGDRIVLDGVTLVNSPFYVAVVRGARAHLNNLKVMGWTNNTDGISTGPGATITDCFCRVADDVIKVFNHVRVERCTLWCDKAAAFQLSWNVDRDCGRSAIRDCDVIHHMPSLSDEQLPGRWTGAVFRSWHAGTGHIHDVTFEDIRVETAPARLVGIHMDTHPWDRSPGRWGRFSNLTFRRVHVAQRPRLPSYLLGRSPQHDVRGVTFEDLRIAGRRVRSADQMPLRTNEFARNIRFR